MKISIELNYFSGFASFITDIKNDNVLALRLVDIVKKLKFKNYSFYPPKITLAVNRSSSEQETEFFYLLAKSKSMENFTVILADTLEITSKEYIAELSDILQSLYNTYSSSIEKVPVDLIEYKSLAEIEIGYTEISKFLDKILVFYGVKEMPYGNVTVYIFPSKTGSTVINAVQFYNTIILPVTNYDDIKSEIGTIIHEICHMIYEFQEPSVQLSIEQFFLTFPSPYAYLTYKYLNESTATAIGNGIFVISLTGKEDTVKYDNPYISRFAGAMLLELIKVSLNEGKEMNKEFLTKAISLFETVHPEIYKKFDQVLSRYIILSKDFLPQEVSETFSKYFKSNHFFFSFIDDTEDMISDMENPLYDHNAPVIFVLSNEEALSLGKFCSLNPYLNTIFAKVHSKIPTHKGLYAFSDETQKNKLYMFFVIEDLKELNELTEKLWLEKEMSGSEISLIGIEENSIEDM